VSGLDAVLDQLAELVAEKLASKLAPQGAAPAPMVTPAEYAAAYSLAPATVRGMIADGRLEAVRIGKRQWRIHRDAPIGVSASGRAAAGETPAARARRILGGGR